MLNVSSYILVILHFILISLELLSLFVLVFYNVRVSGASLNSNASVVRHCKFKIQQIKLRNSVEVAYWKAEIRASWPQGDFDFPQFFPIG